MDILKTATGKEIETDYVTRSNLTHQAFIRAFGKTFPECAVIFSDPAETKKMICGDIILEGFTKLMGIYNVEDCIKVQLEKEA